MEQMLADRYAFIAKADGTPPEPYESLAATASEQGTYFQNHSVQAITGAGQNVMFDHAAAGEGIGTAAVEWATANGISTPIIGVLGNLGDPEGIKRTSVAVDTITEAFPDTEVSGEVEARELVEDGAEGAGNLLAANPDINMLLTFNTISGMGAVQAATEAGKTDPTTFFVGMGDTEPATQDLIASGDSVVQANWGALFEISAVLLIRDALKFADGETVPPTRALGGRLLRTAEDVEAYRAIAEDPTAESAADAYNDPSLVRYSDVALMTGQSINDVQ
jgi:ABC-type sugar transport system substrate-binding protein